jgi:hypothetical protein
VRPQTNAVHDGAFERSAGAAARTVQDNYHVCRRSTHGRHCAYTTALVSLTMSQSALIAIKSADHTLGNPPFYSNRGPR